MRYLTAMSTAALLLALAVTASGQQRRAGDLRGEQREGDLKVGDRSPDFTVKDVDGKKSVKLSELKGKPVVLIFGSCT